MMQTVGASRASGNSEGGLGSLTASYQLEDASSCGLSSAQSAAQSSTWTAIATASDSATTVKINTTAKVVSDIAVKTGRRGEVVRRPDALRIGSYFTMLSGKGCNTVSPPLVPWRLRLLWDNLWLRRDRWLRRVQVIGPPTGRPSRSPILASCVRQLCEAQI